MCNKGVKDASEPAVHPYASCSSISFFIYYLCYKNYSYFCFLSLVKENFNRIYIYIINQCKKPLKKTLLQRIQRVCSDMWPTLDASKVCIRNG
jgi:hypothetical protein